ncbi:MAG: hypothetical protein DWQ07_03505 [Chloroflexi bacterium]|nr:MAG: hypothetical protein DWQ07_03505 [Chloroflexota bacterium]MBL1193432.1 hypothetical protein [Chloroflexota bacterium]NOH10724.1 hypothetical protein [Chloroflexota bacterium]
MKTEQGSDQVTQLLEQTDSDQANFRLKAVSGLAGIKVSNLKVVRKLEKLAIRDRSKTVREAALEALSAPAHKKVQHDNNRLAKRWREIVIGQISKWIKDDLIDAKQGHVLRQRYNFDMAPATVAGTEVAEAPIQVERTKAQEEKPPKPPRTLSEILFSETTIRLALYLGAFFVIAAAFILAAAIETLRLPILSVVTLGFFLAALALRKHLPQASFVLFIVFSFLVPIGASVLLTAINIHHAFHDPFWIAVVSFLAIVWGISTWVYSSRFFSITSLGAASYVAILIGRWANTPPHLSLLLLGLVGLASLAGVYVIRNWKDRSFALPLFVVSHLQQASILFLSLILLTIEFFLPSIAQGWWLAIAATWLIASAFYLASNVVIPFGLFPWLVAGTLFPVSWFTLAAFDPSITTVIVMTWIWGTFMVVGGEILQIVQSKNLHPYGLPLLLASAPLYAIAAIGGLVDTVTLAFTLLVLTAFVYGSLSVRRPRHLLWFGALLSALFAYFLIFDLIFLENTNFYPGFVFLWPTLILLAVDPISRRAFNAQIVWYQSPRILGFLVGILHLVILASSFNDQPLRSTIVFLIYSAFFALYALSDHKPRLGYLATGGLAVAATNLLIYFDQESWLAPLIGLSIAYYLGGLALARLQRAENWSLVLRSSGLVASILVALSAPAQGGLAASITIILAASMYAAEGHMQQKGRLIILANLLYLGAYFVALTEPLHAAFALVVYSAFSTMYGRSIRNPKFGYLALAALSLAVIHLLLHFEQTVWLAPMIGLAAAYYLAGLIPNLQGRGGSWTAVLRTGGLMLATLVSLSAPFQGGLAAIVSMIVAALLYLVEVVIRKKVWPGFVGNILILGAYYQTLFELEVSGLLYFTIGMFVYYMAGFIPVLLSRSGKWANMMRGSGLALGVLLSLAAPLQGGPGAIISVAIAATAFAIEAFHSRNIWLGFPANLLYLGAYFLSLAELQITQPQFYSIGAALLGLIMHYLLVRSRSTGSAFITGTVSQLLLLSTTYIQMVSTEQFVYFFVLFLQSLVVLVYGVVVRSRSLVITPIVFVVLAVITVMFSALSDLGPLLLIGCTGILLMVFGILALALRGRISQATEKLRERLGGWRS